MAPSQSWPEFKLKKKQTILATAFASEFCRMNILIREIALSSRFEPIRIGHILQRGLLQERMRRLCREPRKYW